MAAGTGGDGSAIDMAVLRSSCGHPGDKGNSLGVGQFCTTSSDCDHVASICSTINNENAGPDEQTYFCSKSCTLGGDVLSDCGEGAICMSSAFGGACVPASCPPPDMAAPTEPVDMTPAVD